jgi:hypothetical protein
MSTLEDQCFKEVTIFVASHRTVPPITPHRRRQPALPPRLPSKCIPLPKMWAAVAETGVGALGAPVVGAVAVPPGAETGALPRTPSTPDGRSCLRHDRSSSDFPVALLWSARLYPRSPLHLDAYETCRGVDGWDVGRAISHKVMPACPHAQRGQRAGRALVKLVHRSGDRVFRPTSSKYQVNRSQIAWSAMWEDTPRLVSFFHSRRNRAFASGRAPLPLGRREVTRRRSGCTA